MYISPSQMLAYAGLREGDTYGLGDGTQMEIKRYTSGQVYARLYAQVFAQKQCSGLQVASNNARQDLAAKFLQAARAEGVPNPQVTAGDASFVVDPESGTRYKVSNYSDYHWMNNSASSPETTPRRLRAPIGAN